MRLWCQDVSPARSWSDRTQRPRTWPSRPSFDRVAPRRERGRNEIPGTAMARLGEIIERRLLAASAGRPLFLTCCGRNCSAPSQAAPKLTIAGLVAWNLGSSAALLIALRSIVGLVLVSGAASDRGASSTVPVFQPAQIDSSPTPPVDLEGLTAAASAESFPAAGTPRCDQGWGPVVARRARPTITNAVAQVVVRAASVVLSPSIVGLINSATPGIVKTLSNSGLIVGID